jgi:Domain of unknown function (DUF5666)
MRISLLQRSGRQGTLLALLVFVALTAVLLTTGCGGHSSAAQPTPTPNPTATPTPTPTPSPTPTPTPAPVPTTNAQVRIGDASANRVIDFEVSFGPGPLVVTLSTGQSVNLPVGINRWELSHMAAKMEPLSNQPFPQGNITSIAIPLSNAEVTFLDNTGAIKTLSSSSVPTVTVNLNPALVIGTTPTIVTLDINIASTLTIDAAGNVTAINFSGSTFTFGTKAIGATEADQQDENGEIEGVTGKVGSVTGNSFDLDAGQGGAAITFVTDNTTKFDGGLTLATLVNKIVKVEGFTNTDGSIFAKEVELLTDSATGGSEIEGMITSIPGPAGGSTLGLLVQDGIGNGMDPAKVGVTLNIDIAAFTNYTVDKGKVDMTGVGTGGFDAAHISKGQRIEVELKDGVPAPDGTTTVPSQIKLEQQTLTGTVANYGTSAINPAGFQFDLNLPADSYLTLLTGTTKVTVFQQAGTDMPVGTIKNADSVRVRGLLFFSPPSTWGFVARRITAP